MRHIPLFILLLSVGSLSTAENRLEWIRFDPSARSFETLTGIIVTQQVTDPERFSPGAALLRLPDVDVSTLRGGILLGRVQNKHLSWLRPEEYALGLFIAGESMVAVLPYEGWERGVKYAVRLYSTVLNNDGVPFSEGTWLVTVDDQGIEPPLAPTDSDPVKALRLNAMVSSFSSSSGQLISQQVTEGRLPGVLFVTLTGRGAQPTIAQHVDLGLLRDGEPIWLQPEEIAVGLVDLKTPLLAMFPYHGWEPGSEYVFRFQGSATDNDGHPLAPAGAAWIVEVPEHTPAPRPARKVRTVDQTLGGRFPGGQNLLFHGAWTDPATGLAYHRGRWYDPKTGSFLSEDPKGSIDSENLYAYGRLAPHMYTDPLGLASRTDVLNQDLYYTWNFGWVDTNHAYDKFPGLGQAWNALQNARPGQVVPFSLEMQQKEPGNPLYKQTQMSFSITVAESVEQRKRQLYYAFQRLSEDFETYQGEGLQGIQLINTLYGLWNGEQEKTGSSFSTEDLFSNLLTFYASVENKKIRNIVNQYGGAIEDPAESREFSLLVWDYLLKPQMEGQKEWRPVYIDPENIPTADEIVADIFRFTPEADYRTRETMRASIEKELKRANELIVKYQTQYGQPTLPEELQIEPLTEGVEVTNVKRE